MWPEQHMADTHNMQVSTWFSVAGLNCDRITQWKMLNKQKQKLKKEGRKKSKENAKECGTTENERTVRLICDSVVFLHQKAVLIFVASELTVSRELFPVAFSFHNDGFRLFFQSVSFACTALTLLSIGDGFVFPFIATKKNEKLPYCLALPRHKNIPVYTYIYILRWIPFWLSNRLRQHSVQSVRQTHERIRWNKIHAGCTVQVHV